MTSKKNTRRALFMSITSLILCCAMLMGTTFAWFTDSVTSGNNIINAGNLDVELYYGKDKNPTEKADGSTKLFTDCNGNSIEKWEPGVVAYTNVQVSNEGTLALKYNMSINVTDINKTTDGGKSLCDVLKVAVVPNGVVGTTREAVLGEAKAAQSFALETFHKSGELYPAGSTLVNEPSQSKVYGLVVYWPDDNTNEVDNQFNMNNGKTTSDGKDLHITLGLNLTATQLAAESDAFGPDYDAGATTTPAWDGIDGTLPEEVEGVITISNAAEFAAFRTAVNSGNSFFGKTVVLSADINLGNQNWTPIGACDSAAYFQGTFDGQGHTIYNLSVDKSGDTYQYSTAGLFGWIDAAAATIKNVNINGATVEGSHWVGTVAGFMTGEISNCNVTNATVTGYNVNNEANGDKIGGLVGYMNSGNGKLHNNSVNNSTIIGNRDVAGLAGAVAADNTVINNTVSNVTVIYNADYAGQIVSAKTTVVVDSSNTASNVVLYKGENKADGLIQTEKNTFSVTNKEGLKNLHNKEILPTNSGEQTRIINLEADIDMSGESWTALDLMFFTFNGNGHTISNLNVVENGNKAGFFGYIGGATIKDLTLKNVTATGSQVGVFAGQSEGGDIINCTIDGTNVLTWDDHSGDDITKNGVGAFVGVSVENNTTSGEILNNATIYMYKGNMAPALDKNNNYVGGLYTETQTISIANNGTIYNMVAEGVAEVGTRSYEVLNKAGLLNVNNIIANSSSGEGVGIHVKLMSDIDLAGETWKPIDKMWVDFDGNGHTISNLTTEAWKAGFFGYLAGGSIKNLTLENVNVTGAQAGAFAGSIEGTIDNCVLKGTNTITWAAKHQYDNPNEAVEAWSGIGAITGITQTSTVNATIASGATVTLNKTGMTTEARHFDNYTGYISANKGEVTNNGKVIVNEIVEISSGLSQNKNTPTYYVSNADGLASLNTMMANKTAGRDTVVNLTADIDFIGKTWTPVDSFADSTFTMKEINGNGYTISNLTINGQAMFKRFAGSGDVTIKNITFDNATVNSNGALNTSILTVQSYQNVLLDNVDVKNSTITGGYKVAPLIATVYNEGPSSITATLKDCDVENVTVKATSYDFCTTGMVAFVKADDNDKIAFDNCTVSNVKLYAPNVYTAHAAIYTTGSETLFNEAEGVTVTNVTFENI